MLLMMSMWCRIDTQEFAGPLGSSHKSSVDVEYDANRTVDRHDETYRPNISSKYYHDDGMYISVVTLCSVCS